MGNDLPSIQRKWNSHTNSVNVTDHRYSKKGGLGKLIGSLL